MLRWFYIGVGCVLVAGLLYAESVRRTGHGPADLVAGRARGRLEAPEISLPSLPSLGREPVLVFHVRSPESVALVRRAVADERVLADMPQGFALAEGRIVAVGPDATAALLVRTGWSDRPLDIHQPAPRPPRYDRPDRPRGASPESLAHQGSLSRGEAAAVMEQLD